MTFGVYLDGGAGAGGGEVIGLPGDLTAVTDLWIGGGLPHQAAGKQVTCPPLHVGAVVASGRTAPTWPDAITRLTGTVPARDRVAELGAWLGSPVRVIGVDSRAVVRADPTGRTAGDLAAEVARTVGGLLWADPAADGTVTLLTADQVRPATVHVELDVEADLDGPPEWALAGEDAPTEVTASSPRGSVTATDGTTDRTRVRTEQVATCAASTRQAMAVAEARLRGDVEGLHLRRLRVDLATASADLWAAMMTLRPGHRVRVGGLPPQLHGRTWVDVLVSAVTERHTVHGVTVEITADPAVDEGTYDAARFAGDLTVTGGTALGSTGTGTVQVTAVTGPGLTLDPAAYPLVMDWAGELVEVAGPPATSTSPQTVTLSGRGVPPSVARVHLSGDAFDVTSGSATAL